MKRNERLSDKWLVIVPWACSCFTMLVSRMWSASNVHILVACSAQRSWRHESQYSSENHFVRDINSATSATSKGLCSCDFFPVIDWWFYGIHCADSRFSSSEVMKLPKGRRLAGQYLCTFKHDICEQEPIVSVIGPDCCNSMCTNVQTDMFNCGTCGKICFYGSVCCNGICVDVLNDQQNCGSCFNSCPPEIPCQYGLCGYSWCLQYVVPSRTPYALLPDFSNKHYVAKRDRVRNKQFVLSLL